MPTRDLSPRESEIVRFYAKGFSAKYIAAKLFLSPRTIETHVRHIYEKTGLSTRDELIEYALHLGSNHD